MLAARTNSQHQQIIRVLKRRPGSRVRLHR